MTPRTNLMAAAVVAFPLLTSPLAAQSVTESATVTEDANAVWWRATYKTLTNELVCNAVDLIILDAMVGGGGTVGLTFYVANMTVAAVTYYAHEIGWVYLGPTPDEQTTMTMAAKAATYNVATAVRSFAVAQAFVGDPVISTAYTIAVNFSETAVFLANEWAWNTFADPVQPPR
jgi:uncharacterized membrane protein